MSLQNPKPFELHFLGNSMLPTLRPGDVLLIDPCTQNEIYLGDLVAYYDQSELTVHRLIELNDVRLLKGDAALDILPLSKVDFIVGKVSRIFRDKKMISPAKRKAFYLQFSKYYSKSSPRFIRQCYHLVNFFL